MSNSKNRSSSALLGGWGHKDNAAKEKGKRYIIVLYDKQIETIKDHIESVEGEQKVSRSKVVRIAIESLKPKQLSKAL